MLVPYSAVGEGCAHVLVVASCRHGHRVTLQGFWMIQHWPIVFVCQDLGCLLEGVQL